MMMAHHGITVTGDTVSRAYNDFYYLEKACEYQVTAMSTGRKLRVLDDETCRRLAPAFMEETKQVQEHFKAMKRMLEREAPIISIERRRQTGYGQSLGARKCLLTNPLVVPTPV